MTVLILVQITRLAHRSAAGNVTTLIVMKYVSLCVKRHSARRAALAPTYRSASWSVTTHTARSLVPRVSAPLEAVHLARQLAANLCAS
mmetsp:Transcript_17799/g.32226  ORF Transcript_17799/g.32226 Transcript_17799/m.32226 type:complete len:88 (+) Transcript_17799:1608-1871(+)